MTTTRKFGIEFEAFGLTIAKAAEIIQSLGIAAEVPSGHGSTAAASRGAWKVEYDGSLGAAGFEAVTPPSTSFDAVHNVCRALTRAGAHVTRACGTHVHVDARDLGVAGFRRLAKLWISIENAMTELISASRRANRYCEPSRSRFSTVAAAWARFDGCQTVDHVIAAFQTSRYARLNLSAFQKHGTVEFRLHGGTLNAAKIEKWTRFCVRLVEIAAAGTWEGAAADLPLLDALREAFRVRQWIVVAQNGAAPIAATIAAAPTFTPRAGSKRAELWAIFDANVTASSSDAATIAEAAGFIRKYATDQHFHWRRARTIATTTVAAAPTTRPDDAGEMAESISYFTERAQELASA